MMRRFRGLIHSRNTRKTEPVRGEGSTCSFIHLTPRNNPWAACARPLLLLAILALAAAAQTPATQSGVAPAWDMRETLRGLVEQTQHYQRLVDQIKTSEWVSKGAPDTYVRHQEVVKREVGYLNLVASRLFENPERLPLALDAFFRLQSLETYTLSLSDGARRYQSEQLGNELSTLLARNDGVRTKLRQYLLDLSATKETEYAVAEKEAQRCQSVLNRNPLAPQPKRSPPLRK